MEKLYKVYLFRDKNSVRGWLSYVESRQRYTLLVEISSESSQKAKNKAITLINKRDFTNLKIIDAKYEDNFWGLNKYPELKKIIVANLR